MRKFWLGILVGVVIGALLTATGIGLAAQTIRLVVNRKEVSSNPPPQMIGGRVFVPVRFVAEALGAKVEWDSRSSTVIISSNGNSQGASATAPVSVSSNTAILDNLTYDELARYTERYIGQRVRFLGKVVQVAEGTNYVVLRVNITKTSYGFKDTIWVDYYNPTVRVLKDDIIQITGVVIGRHTYTSVMNMQVTLPRIKAETVTVNPDTTTQTINTEPGRSRQSPIAKGMPLTVTISDSIKEQEFRIAVLDVVRGAPASAMIREANIFNSDPKPRYEHLLVKLKVDYVKGTWKRGNLTQDISEKFSSADFSLVSSAGKVYPVAVIIPPEPQLGQAIFPGASDEGWIAFEVAADDLNPVLAFRLTLDGKSGAWFSLR